MRALIYTQSKFTYSNKIVLKLLIIERMPICNRKTNRQTKRVKQSSTNTKY